MDNIKNLPGNKFPAVQFEELFSSYVKEHVLAQEVEKGEGVGDLGQAQGLGAVLQGDQDGGLGFHFRVEEVLEDVIDYLVGFLHQILDERMLQIEHLENNMTNPQFIQHIRLDQQLMP